MKAGDSCFVQCGSRVECAGLHSKVGRVKFDQLDYMPTPRKALPLGAFKRFLAGSGRKPKSQAKTCFPNRNLAVRVSL